MRSTFSKTVCVIADIKTIEKNLSNIRVKQTKLVNHKANKQLVIFYEKHCQLSSMKNTMAYFFEKHRYQYMAGKLIDDNLLMITLSLHL